MEKIKELIGKMYLENPNEIGFNDVDNDIFNNGPYFNWLKRKAELLKIEFPIKNRSLIDRLINRKVKKYKVKTAVNNVVKTVDGLFSKMDGDNDVDISLTVCAVLILNKPEATEKQIERIKSFITINASIAELLLLIDLLIEHTGCVILYNRFKRMSLTVK